MNKENENKYLIKKRGPTEIRTRINGFKIQCANRYTIGPTNISIISLFIISNILITKLFGIYASFFYMLN